MKIVKLSGFIFLSCFLLTACSNLTQPNPGNPAMNDMNQLLTEGYTNNQELAKQGKFKVPSDINNALLPNLQIDSSQDAQSDEKRFNISVNNASAQSFFAGLVKGTDYNMVVSPEIKGTITLNLNNVTIDEALQAVHDNYGYQYQKTSYGYKIFPPGLETRVFTVNYLDISRSGSSNTSVTGTQLSTGGGGITANVSTRSDTSFWPQLQSTLQGLLGGDAGEKIVMNSDAGLIIVRAYPDELKAIAKYLDSVQTNMTRQVILEAKILEVQLTNDYNAGIDWTALGLSQTGATGSQNGSIFSEFFTLDGRLGSSFSLVIKLLSEQGNVQTLSSPRISTLNNQKAIIKVGNDEYYITNVDSTTTSGTTPTNTENVDLKPFFSGISLDVTPQIDQDGNVILHIHPLISDVSQKEVSYKLNSGSTASIPTAASKIRETDNVVAAKNGQIVVIGGLMVNSTQENNAGVPFMEKAPLIGPLFRRTGQSSSKSELVVLLRPIVVGKNTWTDQIRQEAVKTQGLNQGFHFGSHPEIFGNMGENFPTRSTKSHKGNKSYILGN